MVMWSSSGQKESEGEGQGGGSEDGCGRGGWNSAMTSNVALAEVTVACPNRYSVVLWYIYNHQLEQGMESFGFVHLFSKWAITFFLALRDSDSNYTSLSFWEPILSPQG